MSGDECEVLAAAADERSPLFAPVNEFTVSLFHRLSEKAGQENVFVSPFSVSTALSMLMLGARNQSHDQLSKGLHFNSLDEKDAAAVHSLFQQVSFCFHPRILLTLILSWQVIDGRFKSDAGLVLANYVLTQKGGEGNETLQKYKSDLQSLYSAKLDDVDFLNDGANILSVVNEWVKENTKGLIQCILSEPPSPATRLILLNAIYFKGKWEKPFKKDVTKKMPFYNKGQDEVQTDFMLKYQKPFQYAVEEVGGEKTQLIELPYEDKTTSMIIILPDKRDGLKLMLSNKNFLADVTGIISNKSGTEFYKTTLDIFLPKFKLETEYELNDTLSKMGISDIFSGDADLSGITGAKDLFVSLIKHKAVVKVDEEGTEAAAVTAVVMMRMCAMIQLEKIEFRVDHPFLFVIKDKKTGLALFIGKVESF